MLIKRNKGYEVFCDCCGQMKITETPIISDWTIIQGKQLSLHFCDICSQDPFIKEFFGKVAARSGMQVLQSMLGKEYIPPIFLNYSKSELNDLTLFYGMHIKSSLLGDNYKKALKEKVYDKSKKS